MHHATEYASSKTGEYPSDIPQFSKQRMQVTVFLEVRYRKTVRFYQQIISTNKYLLIYRMRPIALVRGQQKITDVNSDFLCIINSFED